MILCASIDRWPVVVPVYSVLAFTAFWMNSASLLIKGSPLSSTKMYSTWQSILKIQKFRRVVSYAGLYCLFSGLVYAYTNNSTRAGISRADQYYSSYPAGTELLSDTTKLYKTALGNVFEEEEWGPIEFSIMAKHFERQGKAPYAYHATNTNTTTRLYKNARTGI